MARVASLAERVEANLQSAAAHQQADLGRELAAMPPQVAPSARSMKVIKMYIYY